MDNDTKILLLGFVLGILLSVAFAISFRLHPEMYKNGQIDALNGNVYYELQEQEDGTTQWIYVPDGVEK